MRSGEGVGEGDKGCCVGVTGDGSFQCAGRGVITVVDTEGNESIVFPISLCAGGFDPDRGVRGVRVRVNSSCLF